MYEAADVDGASTVTKFLKITLPALKPAILVALLFRSLDSLRMFDLAYVMTGGSNDTSTVSMVAYDFLIKRLDMGVGSAMSVLVFLLVLGVAFIFVKVLGASPEGAGPKKPSRRERKLAASQPLTVEMAH
jgi:multiple sugar transport system permease protein